MDIFPVVPGMTLELGKTGTHYVRAFRFDISAWQEAYPDGIINLIHRMPDANEPYVAGYLRLGEGYIDWVVQSSDVAVPGYGECELVMIVDGVAVDKTDTYPTHIEEQLGTNSVTPPTGASWVEQVLTVGNATLQAVEGFEDLVAEKEQDITDLASGKEQDITDLAAQKIAAIEAKGAQTLDSIPEDYSELSDDVDELKSALTNLEGEAVKTVNNTYPDENGNVSINMVMTNNAADLFETVLSEAFYGSDQRDNISSLIALLKGHNLVSLSAELNGLALIGTPYSELDFIVTGTYSDETTATVYHYTVSNGTVVDGSNTVTILYRGVSTTVTFTATTVITHTITYNLQGITSSNMTAIIAEGDSYTTEFTVSDNYTFSSCTVTMGGIDITEDVFSNLEILIQEVTGDIVITAVAIENVVLNILKPTSSNKHSVVYVYSDDYETQITRYNNAAYVFVSEYPALNACRIKWKITNNTEETISIINGCAIGSIPAFDQSWKTDSYFRAAYVNEIKISGNNLVPGASLEGIYDLHSEHQLVFIVPNTSIDIELIGGFEPNEFTGYTKLISDSDSAYGSYRNVTWYKDAGITTLLSRNSSRFNLFDKKLNAGSYDVIARIVPKSDDIRTDKLVAGGSQDNTSTTINNSFGLSVNNKDIWSYVWVSGEMAIADSSMDIVSVLDYPAKSAIELYVKERV